MLPFVGWGLICVGFWGDLWGISGDMGILYKTVAGRMGRSCATILRQCRA